MWVSISGVSIFGAVTKAQTVFPSALFVPHQHHRIIPQNGNTGGTTNKHCETVWTAFCIYTALP